MRRFYKILSILLCVTIFMTQFNAISAKSETKTNNEIKSMSTDGGSDSYENIIVNFSTAGGSLSEYTKVVKYGKVYGTLPTPVLDGYTFGGWYTQVNGGNHITETSVVDQMVTHSLYARWNPITSTVYFNANGGVLSGNESKTVSFGQEYGELPSSLLENYTFKGWYTLPSGGEKITSEDIVNITSSAMLYAQWSGTPVKITFNPDGGTVSETNRTLYYGDNYGTLPVPTKNGFNFEGWYLSDGGNAITDTTSVKYDYDHTLYAQWGQKGFTITFDPIRGSVSPTSKSIQSGELYGTLPTANLKGCTFLGWFNDAYEYGVGAQITSSDTFNFPFSPTLFAHFSANQYTIRLIANGGTLAEPNIIVSYNGQYGDLPTPTLANYTFDGWYTNATYGTEVYYWSELASDMTIYAHWIGNEQYIGLDPNGGYTSTQYINANYGCNYGTLPTPTLTGYTFEGWYTSLSGSEEITSEDIVRVTSPQTLYAHWSVKKPVITYDGNGGNVIANGESDTSYVVNLTYGEPYGTLPDAYREGYSFQGWYTSSTAGTKVNPDQLVTATTSTTLYARWFGNLYTVRLDAMGGSVDTDVINVLYGNSYNIIFVPTRANYTFEGWYTDPITGSKITDSTTVKIVGDQSLYAHWSGTRSKAYFNAQGGYTSSSYIYVYYNEAFGTLPIPTLSGYDFLGWYTDPSGGVEIKDTSIVSVSYDQNLYAHWSLKRPVVTFDANGGYVGITSKGTVYGEVYGALPTPSRPGYSFLGWFTSATGSTQITENSMVQLNADATLYAKWSGNSYYVYFNANGGSVTTTEKPVTNGASYGTLTSPTRSGYTFGGWYTQQSGGVKIASTSIVDITNSYTLYAHWTQDVYTVTFSPNGGTVDPTSTTVTKGAMYSDFPTPTYLGYSFTGWYSASSSSGTLVTYVTAAKTIYAHWTGNTYTVLFDANGGSVNTYSMNVIYGGTYGTLPVASRPNYTFSGWYTAASGGQVRSATSSVIFTGIQTLYAHWKGVSSKVSYNSNGGTAVTSTKTVYYDEPYGTLSTTTRTGYTFDGWYTSPSGGSLVNSDTIVKSIYDQTLYAHWTVYTPTITFNANGGRVIENGLKVLSMNVVRNYGEQYGILPIPTRIGYAFDGWFTSATGSTRVTESTIITAITSATIYAHWIGYSNIVQFDANGGSNPQNSLTVVYGSTYGTLPTPVLTGYEFLGWYTQKAGGTKVTASTVVNILGMQTLYARWQEDTVSITFDGCGGSMVVNDVTVSSTTRSLTYGGTYGGDSGMIPAPGKTGYDFDGWYTQLTGGSQITINTNVMVTSAQRLYAQYTAKNIEVTLNENGGDLLVTTKEVSYGTAYGYLPIPVKDNYSFTGWFTTETGSTQVTESTIMNRTSQHTLYAHWLANSYQVTFNANGGSVSQTYINAIYESTYGTLPTPTRTNCSFVGWYTANVGGNKITSTSIVKAASNTTLYAHWQEGTYLVTYNANGGSVSPTSKTVMINQNYGTLPVPTRTGYYFEGWYTDAISGNLISAASKVQISGSQTIYAHWMVKTPTIVFYANGGNLAIATKTANYGGIYGELPTPTLAHYTFDGWFTSLAGTTQIIATSSYSQVNTQILYAHWTPETYTVTYNANGGTVSPASKVVTYEKTYGSLPTPIFTNHVFQGWYTAPTGGELINSTSIVTETANHTLYAQWRGASYILTFNANGGDVSVTNMAIYLDEVYGELPTPTRTGYYFEGWYTQAEGGTKINSSDNVVTTASFTVYAHWSIAMLTVTFDAMGGTVDTEYITVPYGGVYGVLPTPTMENWTFDGWYTEPQGGYEITEYDTVLLDTSFTVYAHWKFCIEVNETPEELLAEYQDEYLTNRILPELIENGWGIDSIDEISLMDDYDGDGLNLEQEYSNDTDPFQADTDMDGLNDYEEIMIYSTDPLKYDTDEDGMLDRTEVSLGLNPLSNDSDEDGITDSEEVITQPIDLELIDAIDINSTMVKPSVEITGAGDYYSKLYAQTITDNPAIDAFGCVVGNAFEFLHDENLTFESSTLTFTISDAVLQDTPLEDLAIAYYDFDNNVLEVLDTDCSTSGNTISAEVDHYSYIVALAEDDESTTIYRLSFSNVNADIVF